MNAPGMLWDGVQVGFQKIFLVHLFVVYSAVLFLLPSVQCFWAPPRFPLPLGRACEVNLGFAGTHSFLVGPDATILELMVLVHQRTRGEMGAVHEVGLLRIDTSAVYKAADHT